MKTDELNAVLSKIPIFKGTVPSDRLIWTATPYTFVSNTQDHTKQGSHWVVWYVEDEKITFFDSYGRSPKDNTFPQCFENFVKGHRMEYNPRMVEGLFSTTCGEFCTYFIYKYSAGMNLKSIYRSFSNDLDKNDDIVNNFVKQL